MRAVYKKSIFEKIDEAIVEAKILNKTIEHVVLTKEEYKELHTTMVVWLVPDQYYVFNVAENKSYCGVKLVVEE